MNIIRKVGITIFAMLLSIFVIIPSSYASAYTWSNNINDSMAYVFPGAGWGSATYKMSNFEDYSYNITNKVGTSKKRQVSLKVNTACPYTCEIRFSNNYTDSRDGSLITGIASSSYSPGSYWSFYQEPGTGNYINAKSISSSINSQLNLKTTVGLYVNNSGWLFADSEVYYGSIR